MEEGKGRGGGLEAGEGGEVEGSIRVHLKSSFLYNLVWE